MELPTRLLLNRKQKLEREGQIIYQRNGWDYGYHTVRMYRFDGKKEIIGYVRTISLNDELWYVSTNRKGKQLFTRTTDFNKLNKQFERYADRLSSFRRAHEYYQSNYSLIKNPNTMHTQSTTPKQKKVNQLIFVEYEKIAGDGHFITVVDSYRNVIGRIHKNYNDQLSKYEYAVFDHNGNLITQGDKIWELKKEFTNNREQLLEDAHQRRIASKQKEKQTPAVATPAVNTEERKQETATLRQGKKSQEQRINKSQKEKNARPDRQTKREEELKDMRDDKSNDRADMDLEP